MGMQDYQVSPPLLFQEDTTETDASASASPSWSSPATAALERLTRVRKQHRIHEIRTRQAPALEPVPASMPATANELKLKKNAFQMTDLFNASVHVEGFRPPPLVEWGPVIPSLPSSSNWRVRSSASSNSSLGKRTCPGDIDRTMSATISCNRLMIRSIALKANLSLLGTNNEPLERSDSNWSLISGEDEEVSAFSRRAAFNVDNWLFEAAAFSTDAAFPSPLPSKALKRSNPSMSIPPSRTSIHENTVVPPIEDSSFTTPTTLRQMFPNPSYNNNYNMASNVYDVVVAEDLAASFLRGGSSAGRLIPLSCASWARA